MKRQGKRTWNEDWKIFVHGIKIAYQICPQLILYNIFGEIAECFLPYFSLYMSAWLINELTAKADLKRLFFIAGITVTGVFLINLMKRYLSSQKTIYNSQIFQRHELYLMDVQNKFQYQYIENAEVTLKREEIFATAGSIGGGIYKLYYCIPSLIRGLFQVMVSITLTLSMFSRNSAEQWIGILGFMNSHWSTLCFFVIVVLNIICSVKINLEMSENLNEAWKGLTKNNTIFSAYLQLNGPDVIIMDMKKVILRELEKVALRPLYIRNVEKINIKYVSFLKVMDGILNLAIFMLTAAKAFMGIFGIGNFVLYRGTISRLVQGISTIAQEVGNLRFNNQYVLRELDYISLPDQMYKGTLAVEKREDLDYEIEFQNVSFRYPNTDTWALRDVSMKFRIGDKLAIVGENGSGKTTFIKLLCRLYDPTEGKILLNGIDITRYRFDEYMSLFSVVFQDYRLFQFSIAENVAASMEYDEERVKESLRKAGFGDRLNELEKGIHTVLGRDYENDGISLSGGEEQKLALARALYKDAPFVILDEPTAALDPIAEAEVYESFNRIVENKTAVYISHRLSSCRFCDEIAVFDKGRIVESGTHDDLAAGNGKYQELWEAQAKYYRETPKT